MATLDSILEQLASQHALSARKIGDGHFSLELRLRDERCQVVYVAALADRDARAWLLLNSSIGPLARLDCRALLERNDAWAHGPGYARVAADKQEAFVQALLPLEGCDAARCRELLFQVASLADALEAEYLGVDEA